ncbi:MAG TPA: hypothetical protein VJU87_01000 [Gemmatimonadaceae bacterium]|nr:hypothetical protein [Gemmatimonadaceae bacterium]
MDAECFFAAAPVPDRLRDPLLADCEPAAADRDLAGEDERVLAPADRPVDAERELPLRDDPRVALDLPLPVRPRALRLLVPRVLLLRVDDPRRDFPPLVAIYDSPGNRKCGTAPQQESGTSVGVGSHDPAEWRVAA